MFYMSYVERMQELFFFFFTSNSIFNGISMLLFLKRKSNLITGDAMADVKALHIPVR